ncbi:MAG: Ig-like domain-containing protein [Candidatus Gracilibacteria bacterium]|jgi:hypothetical protein|nr:Ig-like domain-containing protein [Candidatus Gracilibacteria bacterium]
MKNKKMSNLKKIVSSFVFSAITAVFCLHADFGHEAKAAEYGFVGVEYKNRTNSQVVKKAFAGSVINTNPENIVTLYAIGEVDSKIQVLDGELVIAETSEYLTYADTINFAENVYNGKKIDISLSEGQHDIKTQLVNDQGTIIKEYSPITINIDTTPPKISPHHRSLWVWDRPYEQTMRDLYADISDSNSGINYDPAYFSFDIFDNTAGVSLNKAGDKLKITKGKISLIPENGLGSETFTNEHNYTISFYAYDNAGNMASASTTFTIDYVRPKICTTDNLAEDCNIRLIGFYDPNNPNCATDSQCKADGTYPGYMPYKYSDSYNNKVYTNPTKMLFKAQKGIGNQYINEIYFAKDYFGTSGNNYAYLWYRHYMLNQVSYYNKSKNEFIVLGLNKSGLLAKGANRISITFRDTSLLSSGYSYRLTMDDSVEQYRIVTPPSPIIRSPLNSNTIRSPRDTRIWNLSDDRTIPAISGTVTRNNDKIQIVRIIKEYPWTEVGRVEVQAGDTAWTIENTKGLQLWEDKYTRFRIQAAYKDTPNDWSGLSQNYKYSVQDFIRPSLKSINLEENQAFAPGTAFTINAILQDSPFSAAYEFANGWYGGWRLNYDLTKIDILDKDDNVLFTTTNASIVSNKNGTWNITLSVPDTLPGGDYKARIHIVDNAGNENEADTIIPFIIDDKKPIITISEEDGSELDKSKIENISSIFIKINDDSSIDQNPEKTYFKLFKYENNTWKEMPITGVGIIPLREREYRLKTDAYILEEGLFQFKVKVADTAGNSTNEIVETIIISPGRFEFENSIYKIEPDETFGIFSQELYAGQGMNRQIVNQPSKVTAKLETVSGDLDEITIYENEKPVIIRNNQPKTKIYSAYPFDTENSILKLRIKTPEHKKGVAKINIGIEFGSGVLGTITIDTTENKFSIDEIDNQALKVHVEQGSQLAKAGEPAIYDVSIKYNATPKGLIAHYTFDEDLSDLTSNENDIDDIKGNAELVKSIKGSALKINASTNDKYTRRDLKGMTSKSVTMEGWFKATDQGRSYSRILEIGSITNQSTAITIDSKDMPDLNKGIRYWTTINNMRIGGHVKSSYDYHDNKWHHVALTYDNELAKLSFYVDGVLAEEKYAKGEMDSDPILSIGNNEQSKNGYPMDGLVDEVKIYNRALNNTDILTSYQEVKEGLILHLPLNGTLKNLGNTKENGVGLNEFKFSDDSQMGKVADFDGEKNAVKVSALRSLQPESMSVSLWVNPKNDGTRHSLLSKWNPGSTATGYTLEINNDATVKWGYSNGGPYYGTRKITWDKWHHLVGTYNHETREQCIYIDGVRSECRTAPSELSYKGNPDLYLSGSWDRFKGQMSDVKIYNRAVSDEEVAKEYRNKTNGTYLHYTFDESLEEKTGNGSALTPGAVLRYEYGIKNKAINQSESSTLYTSVPAGTISKEFSTETWVRFDSSKILDNYNNSILQFSNNLDYWSNSGFWVFTGSGKIAITQHNGTKKYDSRFIPGTKTPSQEFLRQKSLETGKWHHIITTFDGTHLKLYQDGEIIGSYYVPGYISNNKYNRLTIGTTNRGSFPHAGLIDELKIYKKVLTEEEIKEKYVEGSKEEAPIYQSMSEHKEALNGVTYVNGVEGEAILYTEGETYFKTDIKDQIDFDGEYTISFWAQPAYSRGEKQTLFNKGKYGVFLSDQKPSIQTPHGSATQLKTATNAINPQEWHHFALRGTDKNTILYVDGQIVVSTDSLNMGNTENIFLGRENSTGSPYYGKIDEFKIFDHALSSIKISQIYRQQEPKIKKQLANWTLDDAIDASGQENNLTKTGQVNFTEKHNKPLAYFNGDGELTTTTEYSLEDKTANQKLSTKGEYTVNTWFMKDKAIGTGTNADIKVLVVDVDSSGKRLTNHFISEGYNVKTDYSINTIEEVKAYDPDIVLFDNYWGIIRKSDLANNLYDAGYTVISQGNDTINTITPIVEVANARKSGLQNIKGLETHPLNPGKYALESLADSSRRFITKVKRGATVLGVNSDDGSPEIIYLEEPGKGRWLHIQPMLKGVGFSDYLRNLSNYLLREDIISKGKEFTISIKGQKLYVYANGVLTYSQGIKDESWYNVAISTKKETDLITASTYINGKLVSKSTINKPFREANNEEVIIGKGFKGFIDNTQLFNYALNTKEILDEYSKELDLGVTVAFMDKDGQWFSKTQDGIITIKKGEEKNTKVHIISPKDANGVYPFNVNIRSFNTEAEGNARSDFIVYQDIIPEGLSQQAYEKDIVRGAITYDTTPELFFNAIGEKGEKAFGYGSGDFSGTIDANHEDERISVKLYGSGLTGHLWSENAGWIVLDSDGQPGSTNSNTNNFGVNRDGEHLTGKAWSHSAGWVYLSCLDLPTVPAGCAPKSMQCRTRTTVQENNFGTCINYDGLMHGFVWSEVLGWISMENIQINQTMKEITIADSEEKLLNGSYVEKIEITGHSYITKPLIKGKTYYWRVRLKEEDTYLSYSEIMTFTIPDTPTIHLQSPANDHDGHSVIADDKPSFKFDYLDTLGSTVEANIMVEKWNDTSSAWETYQESKNYLSVSKPESNDAVINLGQSFEPGKYKWKVVARDASDAANPTSETSWNIFHLDTARPTITCLSPTGTITSRIPKLEFNIKDPENKKVKWRVLIDQNSAIETPEIISSYSALQDTGATGLNAEYQVMANKSLPGGTIYYAVEAINEVGSRGRQVCSFSINGNTAPVITSVELTANGIGLENGDHTTNVAPSIKATFTDESQSNTSTCKAEIALDSGFTNVVWNQTLENVSPSQACEFNVSPLHRLNQAYYWRVTVSDSEGLSSSAHAPAWTFILDSTSPDTYGNIGIPEITDDIVGEKTNHKYAINIASENTGNNTLGWFDMNPKTGGVMVLNDKLLGYAWNDVLGWIRFNCQESDMIGIDDSNICSSNNFGLKNDGSGNLSGSAYIEKLETYLHFDGSACSSKNECPSSSGTGIGVYISQDGKFSGYAWSKEIGWIDFGGSDTEDSDPNSQNYFYPITSWASDAHDPVLLLTDDYRLFTASSSKEFPLATDNQAGDRGFYCPGGLLDTSRMDLRLIDINNPSNDLTDKHMFQCSDDKGNNHYGQVRIVLNGSAGSLSEKAGGYKLTGSIEDYAGNSVDTNNTIFQVIADKPDLSITGTFKIDEPVSKFANGSNKYTISLNARDQYENPIKKEIALGGAHQGEVIKNVNAQINIENTVDFDQTNPMIEWDSGDAVSYTALNKTRIGQKDAIIINDEAFSVFDITSYAPTNTTNKVNIEDVKIEISSDLYTNIGKCATESECSISSNTDINFLPMITTGLVDENGDPVDMNNVQFTESRESTIRVKVKNQDPAIQIDNATFHAKMEAYSLEDNAVIIPEVIFNDMRLTTDEGANISDTFCHFQEDGEILPPEGADLNCTIYSGLSELEESSEIYRGANSISSRGIMSRKLFTEPNAPSWGENTYNIAFTPTKMDEVIAQDVGVKYEDYIGYHIEGAPETVKFKMNTFTGGTSFIYKEISVEGVISGEKSDKDAIFNPDETMLVDEEAFLSFEEMFGIIYQNVQAAIRGKYTPSKHIVNSTVNISSWTSLVNPSGSAEVLQDGQIIWYHGENFTLNINGDLKIPQDKPYTLIVDGGNIILKGNIIDDSTSLGEMSGKGMLGIIILKNNKETNTNNYKKSGHLLIDPSVTNIKASIVAEHSIFSATGENVYDGFNIAETDLLKQLYLKGTIMSRNTLGGEQSCDKTAGCQIPDYKHLWFSTGHSSFGSDATTENRNIASRFDLSHLRQYIGGNDNKALNVPRKFARSSVIIEYNEDIKKESKTPPLFRIDQEIKINLGG